MRGKRQRENAPQKGVKHCSIDLGQRKRLWRQAGCILHIFIFIFIVQNRRTLMPGTSSEMRKQFISHVRQHIHVVSHKKLDLNVQLDNNNRLM